MSANVQSQPAISDFRADLCTFIVEARQALTAIDMEARRAVEYITETQAQAWQGEVRRGVEKVAHAKLEIHNVRTFKRVGDHVPSCIQEKKELDKAERRLRLAEAKIEAVRHWGRIAEQAFREFQTRLAQFIGILDGELPKAVSSLERILMTLDEYLAVEAPIAARESAASQSTWEQSSAARTMTALDEPSEENADAKSVDQDMAVHDDPSPSSNAEET